MPFQDPSLNASKKYKLFDWEDDPNIAPLDENNLETPEKEYTFEEAMEGKYYTPGQETSVTLDRDIAERGQDLIDEGTRDTIHYGADNVEDLIAHDQSTTQKWGYGLTKFVGKTGVNIVGAVGMLGSAVGTTGDWLVGGFENEGKEGKEKEGWKDIWDNSFQRSLQGVNEWMDKQLPNYYTLEEQNRAWYKNILGDGGANFWADKMGNGLSFIAGAVLSELALTAATVATFGAAGVAQAAVTAGYVAKAAQILKGLSKGKAMTNASRGVKVAEQFGKQSTRLGARVQAGGKLTRQLITGAGYESGVEARAHIDGVHEELKSAKEAEVGRKLTDQEDADIYELATASGNAVFAGNLALVGIGNMIAFPKLFKPGFGTTAKNYGKVVKGADGTYKAAHETFSKARTVTNYAYAALKRGAYEGIIEEGGQAWLDVAGKHSATDFYMRGHRPTQADAVKGLMSSMFETMEKNYGSSSTHEEMFIGFLLGAMGLPTMTSTKTKDGKIIKGKKFGWTGGAYGSVQDLKNNQWKGEALAKYANDNPDAFQALKANYDILVKDASTTEEQDVALATNNMFAWKSAEDDRFFNYVRARAQAGYFEDVVDNINEMRDLTNQEFAQAFGYQDLTDEEISARKEKVIEAALKKAEMIKKAIKTVDTVYKGDNDAVREGMQHALSTVELVGEREESIYNQLDDITNGKLDLRTNNNLSEKNQRGDLLQARMGSGTTTLGVERDKIELRLKKDLTLPEGHPDKLAPEMIALLQEQLTVIDKGIAELSVHNAVDDINFMELWKRNDPDGYAASPFREQARQMLADIRKLRERRQEAISMHNELNTVRGEQRFMSNIEQYTQAFTQQEQEQKEAKVDEAVKTNDPEALWAADPQAEFLMRDPENPGKEILMKFKGKDMLMGAEEGKGARQFSSKLLESHLIKVTSLAEKPDVKPTKAKDISVENSIGTSDDFFALINDPRLLRPDFLDVGFNKTSGILNVNDPESMSEEQRNFFQYVHSTNKFDDVEIELVAPKNEKYPWLDFFDKEDIRTVVVDKKSGEPIKFNNQYVASSLMLPTLVSSNGNDRFSGLEGISENEVEKRIEEFTAFREQVKQGNVRVSIQGRSMLFPNYFNKGDRFGVTELIHKRRELADADIRIAVSDTMPVDGHLYRANPGEAYIIHNNIPVPLYHRAVTPQEIETISSLLVMYAKNKVSEDPNIRENPDQILNTSIGRNENLKIINSILGMIRFGAYKSGSSNSQYQIKLVSNGVQYKGNKIATFKALAANDPETIEALKDFLATKIHDINGNFLKNNDPHYHAVIGEEGVNIEDYTNYKEYLLAPRTDALDIPYTTNIVPPAPSGDNTVFQFKGGYLRFNAPVANSAPIVSKKSNKNIRGKKTDSKIPLKNKLTLGTHWSLQGNKNGKLREAIFEVKINNGVTTLAVAPGQDELMTALVQDVLQANLNNESFTMRDFHKLMRESFEQTIDQYAEIKPDLLQLDPVAVNPFEAVKDKVHNVKKKIVQAGKYENYTVKDYSINGVPVYETEEIKTKEGTPGIAQRVTEEGGDVIYINPKLISSSYLKKAWTTPRKLKDGSSATALPVNSFQTVEEWTKFILEHEFQHTLIKQKKKETSGEYEDRINIASLKESKKVSKKQPDLDLDWGNLRTRRQRGNTKKLDAQRKLKGTYKKINIEQEREWFESKFNIPFTTVKGLVSGSNYGEFRQLADVVVSEMAIEGTTYHEAFHVVHDYFWSPEEKTKIYNDYKRHVNNPNLTNNEIEEQLAEEFRHYMLKDGLSTVPPVKGLKAWFKRLWDYLKALAGKGKYTPEGVRLAHLFDSIRTTDYRTPDAERSAVLNRFFIGLNPTVKNLEGANVTETKAIVDGFINSVFDELSKEESNIHIMDLFELTKNVDISSEFGVLMDNGFANMLGTLRTQIEDQLDDGSWVRKSDWTQEKQDDVYANARFIQENRAEIYDLFSDWLEGFGIDLEFEVDETNTRKENNFGNTSSVLSVSAKGNAPQVIKLLIASLPINDSVNDINGLHGIVDYRNVFDSLHNELAGVQDFEAQMAAITQMAINRPNLASPLEILLERLKSNFQPSNLNIKDKLLQLKFNQQFDKTKNTYYLSLIKGSSTIHNTDSNSTKTENLISSEWQTNFRMQAISGESFLKVNDETGGIIIDPKKTFKLGPRTGVTYKTLPALRGDQYFNFLELVGITFTNPTALRNNPASWAEIVEQTTYIKKFFLDKQGEDITLEVENLFKDEDSGVTSRLNALIKLELPYYTNTIELQHITPDNKRAYGITLGNFLTRVTNSLSRGIMPKYLTDAADVIQGSKWLEHTAQGGGIKVVVLEGASTDESGTTGKVTKDLTPTDRDALYIHNTLNGRYPLLQASEKKTVFGFELSDSNGMNIGAHKLNRAKALNELMGHLKDEMQITINLVRDNVGNDIQGFRENARGLRVFDFLNEYPLSNVDQGHTLLELLQNKDSRLTAGEIMVLHQKNIREAIDIHLSEARESTKERLREKGLLLEYPSGVIHLYGADIETLAKTLDIATNSKEYKNLNAGEKLRLNSLQLDSYIDTFVLRDRLASLEQLKLFFGDIGFFTENSLYKRTAGPHGVKKFAITGDALNNWLKQNIERYDKKTPDDRVRTIVFRDVKARSQYYEEYINVLGPTVAAPYREYTEADAQGYITIDEYVEFLARTSDLTLKHLELYQRVQNGEVLSSEDMLYFTPLKPQYFGPTENTGLFSPAYYKLSLAVLLPQMLQRRNPKTGQMQETTLKRLHDDMVKHQIGIAVFESGVKIGSKVDPETGLHQQFYGRGGKYPKSNIKVDNIQTLYYDYLGIQVDMGTKVKDKTSRGTQPRQLILANLYNNGVPISPEAETVANEYSSIHQAITTQDFANFTHKLGFNSSLEQVEDLERIKQALTEETRQRKLSDNEVEGLEILLASDDKFLELLSNKPQLDSVLHSLFKRDVIAKKYFGGAYVQMASTGMEFTDEGRVIAMAMKQKDHTYGSELSPLNFYTLSKDGKEVLGMEVMLPHYFKEFLGNNLDIVNGNIVDADGNIIAGEDFINILGFRIPTSGLNSIEAITIKGFLPAEAGEAIMMPSEIVVKSGSDFDVDKLTVLFPNYTVVNEGNVKRLRKIPYLDETVDNLTKVQALRRHDKVSYIRMAEIAELETDKLFRKYFDNLEVLVNTAKKEMQELYNSEAVTILDGQIDKLKDERENTKTVNGKRVLTREIEDLIMDKMSIVSGYTNQIYQAEQILEDLDKQLAESDYFNSLSNELQNAVPALQNRELDIARQILTDPANFAQLIRPVGAQRLEAIAEEIAEESGVPLTEDLSYSQVLNFSHKQEMGQRFWEGMEALGIAALENVSHVKGQQFNPVQVVNNEQGTVPTLDELLEIEILDKNGIPMVVHTLGNSRDINNNHYINEIIGEYMNAFVDVANKPFVYGLNANMETINSKLTLLRKGVSPEMESRFFMQPILRELISELAKTKSFVLPKKRRSDVMKIISDKYTKKASKDGFKGQIDIEDLQRWFFTSKNLEQAPEAEKQDFADGQLAVLGIYNRMRKQALQVSELTTALTYDTNAPVNRIHAKLKKLKLQKFLNMDVDGNAGILGTTELVQNSLIAGMVESTESVLPLFSDFYLTDTNPIINRIIDQMGALSKYNSEQDIVKVIETAENDFVTFLMSGLTVNENDKSLFEETSRLLQGPNSVARRWRKFQKENPTNILARELFSQIQVHSDPSHLGYNFDRVRSFARTIPAMESNLLTEAFMELYHGTQEHKALAEDLVKVAVVQSGMNKSPVSFMKIVPAVLYANLAKEAIDKYKIQNGGTFDGNFYNQFYKNNWNNDLLVPPVIAKVPTQQEMEEAEYVGLSYPLMKNNELLILSKSSFSSRPYLKRYVTDPSISLAKKKRLEKAGKKLPLVTQLFKRPMFVSEDQKIITYTQVAKLGDGIHLKEYSTEPNVKSIINLNNFVLSADKSIKASAVKIIIPATHTSGVIEGDIFMYEGIPVVPINLKGDHSEGIALQAKRKGLIEDLIDNEYNAKTNRITLPIKGNIDSPINLGLLTTGLAKIAKIAKIHKDKKILVPLLEGDVNTIVPLLKALMNAHANISIVLPIADTALSDRGIEHMKVIKKLLNC